MALPYLHCFADRAQFYKFCAVVDIGSPYVGKLNCMDIYTSYGD